MKRPTHYLAFPALLGHTHEPVPSSLTQGWEQPCQGVALSCPLGCSANWVLMKVPALLCRRGEATELAQSCCWLSSASSTAWTFPSVLWGETQAETTPKAALAAHTAMSSPCSLLTSWQLLLFSFSFCPYRARENTLKKKIIKGT